MTMRRGIMMAGWVACVGLMACSGGSSGGGGGGGGGGSTYSISGAIHTAGGAAAEGVTVALSGTASNTTTTDSSGNYSFAALSNGTYTVTPSMAHYTFTPWGIPDVQVQ